MKEKIAVISVFTNLLLAIGKVIVGIAANSVAVLSDGIHSGMDVISSVISFLGINIAKKPIDRGHPYGHYKFEVMSGFLITLILFFTGLWIIYEAFQGFLQPSEVILSPLVLGVMIFSAATNEVMARAKIHYGKLENSVSLLSDGVHSRVDVYTSIAVFVGLILSKYWIYIDSLLALLIGIYIIKKSLSLGKETTDSLLDVSAGEETEERIRNLVKEENIEISELKTQKKGFVVTANMKIELPSKLSVDEAAKISDKLKEKLMAGIKNLGYVAIQIESHDMSSSFFKSRVFDLAEGRGFGWQRRGKFRGKIKEAQGAGPEGHCICEKCGYKTKHERGIPCSTLKCPRCKINLKRG